MGLFTKIKIAALEAGKLRHLGTIQKMDKSSPTQSITGKITYPWVNVMSVHASIDPLSGREKEIAETFAATVSHRIGIRYRPGITTEMIFIYAGRTFAINAILDPEERRRQLVLLCTEAPQ